MSATWAASAFVVVSIPSSVFAQRKVRAGSLASLIPAACFNYNTLSGRPEATDAVVLSYLVEHVLIFLFPGN